MTSFFFILGLVFVLSISFLGFANGIIAVLIFSLFSIGVYAVKTYNKLKSEQIKISEARSNIGVYLEQRFDEISAIYKIVQEFKIHESETLKEIVNLRQLAVNGDLSFKEKTQLHNQIETKMPKVLATFEAYPELRSNENFLQLQEAIQDNEANIASSRKAYNGYVNKFNTSIAMFPEVIFVAFFGFKAEELYEAPQEKTVNPLL